MFTKLLLYISSQHATAAHWRRGKLLLCQEYPNNEAGWAAFGAFLQAYPDTPLHIMVDAVEEDFRSEILPHATGNNRQEMLARKLKQLYRATPYSAAWFQGRENDKRHDDCYLFSALSNPDILEPWLNILQAHATPLAGINLFSMVSQSLLAQLKIVMPNLLLISKNSAGLRQSFFLNQQLKASRLTPLQVLDEHSDYPDPNMPSGTSQYADEIEKTRFYLTGQRLLPRDEKLNICILDPENTLQDIHTALSNNPAVNCTRIARTELCKRLGITPQHLPEPCYNAPHFIALGANKLPANLAPTTLTRGFLHLRWRYALYALSTLCVLISMLWNSANLYQQNIAHSQTQHLAAQTQQQEIQYQEVAKQFPAAPVSAENLLKAVNIAQQINNNMRSPEQLMAILSHALDASPSITMTGLKWKLSAQPSSAEEAAMTRQPLSSSHPSPNTIPEKKWQIGYVDGEIAPFNGDYRTAINTIQTFAEHFKQDPAVESVTILQLPLDINSNSGLSGTTLENDSPTTVAKFKLKVLLKQGI